MRVESTSIIISGKSSDLKRSIYPRINLDPEAHHELALAGLDMYHSIPNIQYPNNRINYEYNGNNYEIGIPTGSYEIESLNAYIQSKLDENGHHDIFSITANESTLKCVIQIKTPSVKINFDNDHSLNEMLGFHKIILEGVGIHEGINIVNILSVNSILINCDIIEGSYLNTSMKPILYSFFPNVPPGYKIVENPNNQVFLPITLPVVDTISIWLTDQDGRLLNTRGETITIRLVLKSTFNY